MAASDASTVRSRIEPRRAVCRQPHVPRPPMCLRGAPPPVFRRLFEKRGGTVGQYPVLNFQYRIITQFDSLAARLAIQNRSFEAGGLDAITVGIEQARQDGDFELADLYEAQIADEISHVRFANEWIRKLVEKNPANLLRIAQAMKTASQAFEAVMGREGIEGVNYPADKQGRLEAGFTREEVEITANLMSRP